MSNGNRTDPLAPYTSTGSRSSSIPANPYKKTGQNAYWNGKQWVPFDDASKLPTVAKTQQQMPNLGFWQTAKQAAGAGAGGLVTGARLPFSTEAQQKFGTQTGDLISDIPGLRNVVAAAPESAVRVGSQGVGAFTGVSNLSKIEGDIRAGDYGSAAKNAAFGLTGLVGGGRILTPVKTAKRFVDASRAGKFWQTAGGLGYLEATSGALSPAKSEAPQQTTPGSMSRVSPDRFEEMQKIKQAQASLDYLRTPQYVTTPYGSSIKQTFTDANGFVHTWNPRSKMYEVTSTVAPAGQATGPILGLSAAQQLEFENRLRDIEAETQAALSGLSGRAASAKSEAKEGRMESRRKVAGGSQDIASGLAFLGLDTSPGVLDVAQEYEARAGAQREAAINKNLAEVISGISAQRAEALRRQEREKRDLAATRLALEEENIKKKRDEEIVNAYLGGR